MELHLNPETEARLSLMAAQRHCKPEELIEGLLWDAADDTAAVRTTLNRRYDEMVNGTVKMLDGEEVFERLRQKSEARRAAHK